VTTTLIVLLIVYFMISKIIGRVSHSLPERPISCFSGDIEKPCSSFKFLSGEDSLLSSPGHILPSTEDRPLSGPWDIPNRQKDGPLRGPWESERSIEVEDLPQPTLEYENEPHSQQRQREQTVDPPLVLEELDRPLSQFKTEAGEEDRSGDKSDTLSVQSFPVAIPKRRERNASNPLAAAFRSKNALVGSIIMGEVLNSRGGRMIRRK